MIRSSTLEKDLQDVCSTPDLQIRTREEFGKLLNELDLSGHGIEIGVQAGHFSKIIRSTWRGQFLHLVDRWRHDEQYMDMANVSDTEHRKLYLSVVQYFADDHSVIVYKLDSQTAAKQFPDTFFDWIYLDADHSYLACKADLTVWYPKLKSGGIFAGHDFVDGLFPTGEYGVKSAVEEFCQDKNVRLYLTQERGCPSWYFVKLNEYPSFASFKDKRDENNGLEHPSQHPPENVALTQAYPSRQLVNQSNRRLKVYYLLWQTVWWMQSIRPWLR